MKKYICLLLVVVLLFSFLGGCQKAVPEPEGVPSEITVIVTPKPEPDGELIILSKATMILTIK